MMTPLRDCPRRQVSTRASNLPGRVVLAAMAVVMTVVMMAAACTPRVALEAPKEPITINMNVKIEHEVRVKVDRELDDLFTKNPELF